MTLHISISIQSTGISLYILILATTTADKIAVSFRFSPPRSPVPKIVAKAKGVFHEQPATIFSLLC